MSCYKCLQTYDPSEQTREIFSVHIREREREREKVPLCR
ncbi:unnamed protein product [Musa acuminata subsp. malaccensis]|uniref:(wild Malaysian banana) hypothetical protein n=1 Tax=Musa acuminata subsp. malaccensis TaxID=214687 RepID=A0A804ISG6_MUSAM|nr:unnamed protein product [Musa acuminata subsp. malaccensis]